MSRNDIILGAVALVLVVFSLVVSMVIPRRRPDFPGKRLGIFTAVALLLVIAMLGAVELFGEEAPEVEEPVAAETEPTETAPPVTGTTEDVGGDPARGAEVFAEQGCGGCHVLAAAGTSGTIGPDLDETQPSYEVALEQVRVGGGGMPAYEGQISDDDIRAVASYVAEAAGR